MKDHGPVTVISLDSSVLQENVPMFRSRLGELIEEGRIWIVVDMSNANYLSSMGVAVIVEIKKKATCKGGDVLLACPNHLIKNLLEMTNVSRTIHSCESIQEAIEQLKKAAGEQAGGQTPG